MTDPKILNRNVLPGVTTELRKVAQRLDSKKKVTPILAVVPPGVLDWLYEHARQMNVEILGVELQRQAPEITLSVDSESRHQLGHYKPFRDGLGLMDRVSINARHLARPRWDVLRTVLHEQLHAWDTVHDLRVAFEASSSRYSLHGGKRPKNPHHKSFRLASEKLGIDCNERGQSLLKAPRAGTPFAAYLKRHGIEGALSLVPTTVVGKRPGSKLKKWSCTGCEDPMNVRVARDDFDATCDLCGTKFELEG